MQMRSILAVAMVCVGAAAAAEHRGVVKSSGLPIPGATVTATQGARKLTVWTDESGAYRFEELGAGTWKIEVTMAGFEAVTRDLDPAAGPAEWNLAVKAAPPRSAASAPTQGVFQPLALQQSVQSEVQAALASAAAMPVTPELEQNATESFLVSGSLSRGLQSARQEDIMEAMRAGFREQFEALRGAPGAPGFGEPGPEGGPPSGPMMGGPRPEGGPAGGPMMGGVPGGGPMMGGGGPMRGPGGPGGLGGGLGRGKGALTDRKKLAGAGPSMRDRFFGNRMQAGRDQFHGGAFFTLRNSALDAKPYSLTGEQVEKPSYAQARFGLTGGGTLRLPKLFADDKTFFFANYFGTRSRNPFDQYSTLPLASERAGDFSATAVRGPDHLRSAEPGAIPGQPRTAGAAGCGGARVAGLLPCPEPAGHGAELPHRDLDPAELR